MGKHLTKNLGGRPTKMNDEVIAKLENIFKVGGNIDEATTYANIDRATYYRWIEADASFATKMESAKHYSDIVAKNVVVEAITKDRDLVTAKWWLEKREFKDKGFQTNIQNNIVVMPAEGISKYGNNPTPSSTEPNIQQ